MRQKSVEMCVFGTEYQGIYVFGMEYKEICVFGTEYKGISGNIVCLGRNIREYQGI